MSEHVREPWETAYRINPRTEMYAQEIFDEKGETIATLSWYPVKKNDHTTSTNREDNARRIVACVNHCSGVPNNYLEAGSAQWYHEYVKRDRPALERRIDNLFKQRDEGTKVLRMFESWWRLPNAERTIENIEQAMRSAIELLYAEDTDEPIPLTPERHELDTPE